MLASSGLLPVGQAELPPSSSISILPAQLPERLRFSTAVWTGEEVYLFGGNNGSPDVWGITTILRFVPSTGEIEVVPAQLPIQVERAAAVWTGTEAYIFGGASMNQGLDTIIRFDPETMTAALLPVHLPETRSSFPAVWDGQFAYLFGGHVQDHLNSDRIVKFDPIAQSATLLDVTLAERVNGAAAVWAGDRAYVFGGRLNPIPGLWEGTFLTDSIQEFIPATGEIAVVGALPEKSYMQSAGWDGTAAYLFGGAVQTHDVVTTSSNRIHSYDPATGAMTEQAPSSQSKHLQFAMTNCAAYLFGLGNEETSIVRYGGDCQEPWDEPVEEDPSAVAASLQLDGRPCGSRQVRFDGSASTASAGMAAWHWEFGDDQSGSGPTAIHDYASDGPFQVVLTVTDAQGNTASDTLVVDVVARDCAVTPGPDPEEGQDAESTRDSDWDGIADDSDNCPGASNHEQDDRDGDGVGDVCDAAPDDASIAALTGASLGSEPDRDGDGIPDRSDNCPATPDVRQADQDKDGVGDVCDIDLDGDGILNEGVAVLFLDNCPLVANPGQQDSDNDGVGDACRGSENAEALSVPDPVADAAREPAGSLPARQPLLWFGLGAIVVCIVAAFFFVVARRGQGGMP